MSTPFRIDGMTALVTGGASGIGESTVRVLTEAGASVLIMDVDKERAEALASELPGTRAVICDITDEQQVKETFAGIKKLDILVNNAGIGMVGGIEETTLAEFQRLNKVNVEGAFLVTKYALPQLLSAHGRIVFIGSVAGMVGIKKRFAYCATKGAVVMMARQIAIEYARELRVNCICPGTVYTPFVEGYLEKYHKHEKEEVRKQLDDRQPIGRVGRPIEIAHMVLYLVSDEAEFVTGSVQTIDGGWTAA
jgi:NAD(P)-dependent dehydrogenase (short-subunit alcohol dehydrogenase family)